MKFTSEKTFLYCLGISLILFLNVTPSLSACVTNTTLPYRLPRTVIPVHYNLTISPQTVQPYALKGEVTILVNVVESTSCIVIHQAGLSFSGVTFTVNGNSQSSQSIQYDGVHQFGIIQFAQNLPLGQGSLFIEYDGFLNQNNATGFFVSPLELLTTPTTEEEHKKAILEHTGPTMLATQFEGPYARMAYPCFDEPELKATFDCSIIVENTPNITVLFNTKEVSSYISGSQLVTTYETTPIPISTYLIAFAVGNFEYLEQNNNGIRYRIYCSPGKSQYGAFSMNITIETINYFTNLWGIGYPLNKLDQIAVPRIFQDGMENIGLVTYWPPWILDVPGNYTIPNYQMTTMVVTHELSHMWFGDTVTMAWWSETYNNEGFARYLQYIAAEYLFPEWNVWEEGGKNSWFTFVYSIMKQDAKGTLPAEILPQPAVSGSVSSVKNAFAGPTYPKGACLNRYFNVYLGDEVWNGALGYHLNKWKYQNPTTYELIYDLDAYTDFSDNLREKFIPWLRLESFPVISLDVIEQGLDTYLTLSQTPVSKYINYYSDALWFITFPVNVYNTDISYASSDSFVTSFSGKDLSIEINQYEYSTLVANENHTSYLIIKYSDNLWPSIITHFSNENYDEALREVFIQDIFILTQMSHVTIYLPLDFTLSISSLEIPTLWTTLLPSFFEITQVIQSQEYYSSDFIPALNSYLEDITSYAIALFPLTNSDLESFQSSVLQWSAYYGNNDAIDLGIYFFEENYDYNEFPSYLEKFVYSVIGRYGSSTQYSTLYDRASTTTGIEQQNVLFGLANTQITSQCQDLIQFYTSSLSLSDQLSQSSNLLFYSYPCQEIAWNNIKSVGNQLFQTEGSSAASSVLNSFAGAFSTYEYLIQVEEYLNQNIQYLTADEVRNSLTLIHINIDIINANLNFPYVNYNT